MPRNRPLYNLIAVCIVGISSMASAAEAKRPNVLFLFSDDQRYDTIHALGNEHIKTPNLDRLVDAGFVFTNTYCNGSMSGAASCGASAHGSSSIGLSSKAGGMGTGSGSGSGSSSALCLASSASVWASMAAMVGESRSTADSLNM